MKKAFKETLRLYFKAMDTERETFEYFNFIDICSAKVSASCGQLIPVRKCNLC